MRKYLGLVAGFGIVVGTAILVTLPTTAPTTVEAKENMTFSLAQGEDLYQQYCAACHGVNLEGQGDWRSPGPDGRLPAPPHDETGHTWHHGDQLLFAYTKYGGKDLMAQRGMEFDSGMPGFEDTLTDPEIWAILDYIKSTWPDRVQTIQAQRTEFEAQAEGN